jgi:hypothetical protein
VQRRYETISSAQKQINGYSKAYFWGLGFEEERRETRGEVGMYEGRIVLIMKWDFRCRGSWLRSLWRSNPIGSRVGRAQARGGRDVAIRTRTSRFSFPSRSSPKRGPKLPTSHITAISRSPTLYPLATRKLRRPYNLVSSLLLHRHRLVRP